MHCPASNWASEGSHKGAEMSVSTAQELFVSELKDIYSAEKQAVRAYPRIAKTVQSQELKQALQQHLEQTKQHVERLDRAFEILEKRAAGKTCEGMKGLLDEANGHVEEIEKGSILDAALIGALQRVEHYEISAYGTVATLAEAMGEDEIHELLAETLQEEKDTDEKLTEVARTVNSEALESDEEEEDEEHEEEDDNTDAIEDEEEESATSKKTASKSASKSGSRSKR
jgi:ferritin-like metal-binding protein YciE